MSIWQSILFGFVQGITEFIPVSSSAHLSVLFNLFGITQSGFNAKLFSVFLHFGSIFSVLLVYWNEFAEILFQILEFRGQDQAEGTRKSFPAIRLLFMLFFSCIPLFLILPFNSYINSIFNNNILIGVLLILSGCVLYTADHMVPGEKTERSMSISDALIIGLAQCVSAIPGISRVATVSTAGLATGLKKEFSVKYAVMLSLPVLFASNVLRIFDALDLSFSWADVPACLIGLLVSFVTGIFALRSLNVIAHKGKFSNCAYYSWVAGVLFIILTMIF